MNFKSINPYTDELINEFPTLTDEGLRDKLKRSAVSYEGWKRTSYKERAALFNQVSKLLRENKEKYARTVTLEMGKAIKESIAEVEKCAWVCDYYAENAEAFLKDEYLESDAQKSFVSYEPIGAILAVMPWNFPYWQVFRFAAPYLMAGNVALLKHAPNVTGCAIEIENIFREAGFPEGVFQSLIIEVDQVEKVIESHIVQAATLTGSEKAGASLASLAGKNIKKTVLELGGSDPFIVLADADIEKAATVAVQSRMLNAGQSCIAAKRFMVVESVKDEFTAIVQKKIAELKTGDPLLKDTTTGPLARVDLAENLSRQVQESVKAGAGLVMGGQQEKAHFNPALLVDVKPGMANFDEETFGPAATIIPVKDEKQAILYANQSIYGLGASLWTKDTDKAVRIAREIHSGAVFINSLVKSDPRLPFGGIKKSGYGRELSHHGIKEFVNAKTIYVS
ncbi:NAD-dependent succinate-semialdehyde dehydrogenase [Chondrinema litorale]|uniref:NAD-dependent succinate-semialdehyde dehydrogenase n=1 Tax=Chondrinema litorale TaxID=2994555 RepID=UPI00254385A0|nr:NAD-dependent succinate-semialdehyde dehydrogenase [Chondrinema litorale]UZR97998.1 NAD-dependent succinate-semialdehyde dehydrogenase [Chondrinema litorale]